MNKFHRWMLRLAIMLGVMLLVLPASPKAEALTPSQITAVENAVDQIVAGIPSWADTDAEKALYLHDYVVDHVAYQMVGEHQNAYGALIDGKAVCAGYADAYLKLLNAVGIEARTMTGTAKGERHAWTQVYLNGKCYYTDTTWDDPFLDFEQLKTHNYFNLSYKDMAKDHTFDSASLKYVDTNCTHSGIDYYDIMAGQGTGIGIFDDDTTAKDAAKYFALDRVEGTTAYYICDFRFDGSDAAAWRQNTMWSIATELGLTGTLHASCLEGEKAYQLTLYGTVKTPPVVTVSAVILTPERINLSAAGQTYILSTEIVPANATNKTVSYKSSNKSVATVSSTGVVRAVGEGTATITVTAADGSKTDTCIVTVSLAHVHDAKLKEVPAATATCTKKGNKAYYICEGCGAWFSDAGAKNEIKDKDSVTIPVQEHTPSAWKYDKDKHWKVCTASGCGVTIDGSSGRHKDADKNGKCDTCGYTLNSKVPNETIRDESDSTDPKADMTEDPTGTNPNKPQRQEGEKDVTDFSITTDTLIIIGGIAVGVILLCIILIVISKRKR